MNTRLSLQFNICASPKSLFFGTIHFIVRNHFRMTCEFWQLTEKGFGAALVQSAQIRSVILEVERAEGRRWAS